MKWSCSQLLALTLQFGLFASSIATGVSTTHDASWQPEYVLVATAENITINCESRHSVVFNGTSPGPPISLVEGKTTWIRVHNQMSDQNLTVHWHGLTMRTAPFSDGTPLATQWPIAPGHFFDYEIHPEIGDAGTYFYHSHIGFQSVTAHGLLIVEDSGELAYEYDEEIPLLFSDYYPAADAQIEAGLRAIPFKWSGEPKTLTLNDRTGNTSFEDAADATCKPYVLKVKPGKTYRLRFVNTCALSFVTLGIEGHSKLVVIEADGEYTKPATTDHIQLGSGQRFSALLTTKTQEELDAEGRDHYWLRFESRDRPTKLEGYALLQYDTRASHNSTTKTRRRTPCGAQIPEPSGPLPSISPVDLSGDVTKWLEYTLESLRPQDAFPTLAEVTRTVYITMNQDIVNGSLVNGSVTGSLVWEQNDLAWTEFALEKEYFTPYLITAYTKGTTPDYDAAIANNGWDPETRAFPAKVGEVLDIVWLSNSGPTGGFDSHPIHAHGEHYWDLGSGNGTYDPVVNEERFKNYTPARRDTTNLFRYTAKGEPHTTAGFRAWRIRVTEDNIGVWMMHCHVLQHMLMGMQTVWVFGDAAAMLKEIPQPYIEGYLDYGGSAYGNDTHDPLVLSYFEDESR